MLSRRSGEIALILGPAGVVQRQTSSGSGSGRAAGLKCKVKVIKY